MECIAIGIIALVFLGLFSAWGISTLGKIIAWLVEHPLAAAIIVLILLASEG